MKTLALALLVLAAPRACETAADDTQTTCNVQVEAGGHDREGTPLAFELPKSFRTDGPLELLRDDDSEPVPVQRLPEDPTRAMFVVNERIAAGESRTYQLQHSTSAATPFVRCTEKGTGLRLELRGNPVLNYNVSVIQPPDGIDGLYRRSGHVHPVWTPSGRVVTDEFPADHPHQHGIFNAWVNTEFEGRAVDFWNQAGGTGEIEHVSVESSLDGAVFAQFNTKLRHLDLTHPDGPCPVLDEDMQLRAWNVPHGFLFDIESRQTCVAESPLTINEYHYGGMAFRGAAGWLGQPEHDFLTSDGKTRADGNHTRPVWVATTGLVDGEPCTIVAFGHPDNFRHPQPVRLHPGKPYFVFTPPVLGEFSIEPDEIYACRYRYLVHDGQPEREWYDRVWWGIADPPRIRLTTGR